MVEGTTTGTRGEEIEARVARVGRVVVVDDGMTVCRLNGSEVKF